jgi:hypothetical protein
MVTEDPNLFFLAMFFTNTILLFCGVMIMKTIIIGVFDEHKNEEKIPY